MSATVTPLADWIIVLPLLLCLGGGAALLILRTFVRLHSWLCLCLVALVLAADIILFGRVLTDGPVTMTMGCSNVVSWSTMPSSPGCVSPPKNDTTGRPRPREAHDNAFGTCPAGLR